MQREEGWPGATQEARALDDFNHLGIGFIGVQDAHTPSSWSHGTRQVFIL